MLIVAALGGNALLRRGESPDAATQAANIRVVAGELAALARDHSIVVTHGSGPQVGLLAMQSESTPELPPFPLDVLDAETAGMIGYMLESALRSELPDREIAALLTQVAVDPRNQLFRKPVKPIGPVFAEAEARRLAKDRGWTIKRDRDGYRRVVPTLRPLRILEIETIRALVERGTIVICGGGGGIPVTEVEGGWQGVEAVVDKDLTAGLLAQELGADELLLLTDVDAVYENWGKPNARAIAEITPDLLRARSFPPGSMGPKVRAAIEFVEATHGQARIGLPFDIGLLRAGGTGTKIRAGSDYIQLH